MQPWHSVNLGDALTADMTTQQIRAAFLQAPPETGAAVFTRLESLEGRMHCQVIAYFSPTAASLARTFAAMPCNPPGRVDLVLLVGDESAWREWFE